MLKQILKRLELIKTAISIEDNKIIELQVQKFNTLEYDSEIKIILNLILKNDFENVISLIDDYVKKYSGVVVYENPEIQGLKIELKNFECTLQKLSDEKSEYLHTINTFNNKYSSELGALIQEILELKKENSSKELEETDIDSDEHEEKQKQYENNNARYQNFTNDYEEQLKEKQLELSGEEKQELKLLYRQASKLCHPDMVVDIHKEKAEEIFKILNEAYSQNNLEKIREILKNLELEKEFVITSEAIDDKEILKEKIEELKIKITNIENEIFEIVNNDNYIRIIEIKDFDEYLISLKKELKSELTELKGNKI